jgi:hypothetical protein
MQPEQKRSSFAEFGERLDRRIIFLFVLLSLSIPLVRKVVLPPARMETAESAFAVLEKLEPQPGKIAIISADWGPGTQAENGSQTAVVIEHLMRKRIPFAIMTIYQLAEPFLEELPREVAARLEKEQPDQHWIYGKDWVNLGFLPNGMLTVRGMGQTKDLPALLKTDYLGTPLEELPAMNGIKTIRDIPVVFPITGLVGVFSTWIQFFQAEDYRPTVVHGCTSITIPEAYIYYSSGQIKGFFEGIAGAAWYEKLLTDRYPGREPGSALLINTSLAFAHLVIIGFIVLGNCSYFLSRRGTEDIRRSPENDGMKRR